MIKIVEGRDYLGVSCHYWQVQELVGLPFFRKVVRWKDVDVGDRNASFIATMDVAREWIGRRKTKLDICYCGYLGYP